MLPQLQLILSYVSEPDCVKKIDQAHLVEVCLSSSYFSPPVWKRTVVATAEKVVGRLDDRQLSARVLVRKRALSFHHQRTRLEDTINHDLGRSDKRSNAYFGELVLLTAQELVNRDDLLGARDQVRQYKPLDPAIVSTLEQIQIYEALFLTAKTFRFGGDFQRAEQCFQELLMADASRSGMLRRVTSQISAVRCELGQFESALNLVSSELADSERYQSLDSGNVKRLRLAFAEAHLMKVLYSVMNAAVPLSSVNATGDSWKRAKQTYDRLLDQYGNVSELGTVGKIRLVSISVGLAIMAHLQGPLEAAVACWETVLHAVRECGWSLGYVELIVAYSTSELKFRLGQSNDAHRHKEAAGGLYVKTGRQHYFVGLGTIWPNLLGDLFERHGEKRIIPRWQ